VQSNLRAKKTATKNTVDSSDGWEPMMMMGEEKDLRLIISAIDIDLERGYVSRRKDKKQGEENLVACVGFASACFRQKAALQVCQRWGESESDEREILGETR
jgi:hypothetical protein